MEVGDAFKYNSLFNSRSGRKCLRGKGIEVNEAAFIDTEGLEMHLLNSFTLEDHIQ